MNQPDAISLREFRIYAAELIDHARASGRPIMLTQQSKPSAVVLGIEQYEELVERLEILEDLRKAEDQAARGEACGQAETTGRLLDQAKV